MQYSRNPAPNGRTAGVKQWLAQIDRALQASDMAEASGLAGQALDFGYRHPSLFNLRAHGKQLQSQHEEALADLMRSHDLNPRSAWTLADIADCHNVLGQWRKALAAADAAIAVDRKYSKAWFQKGLAHQALRELGAARTAYLDAIRLEPTLGDAQARLASMAAEQGRLEESRGFATAALAAMPGHPIAVLALVTTDMGEGRFEDAERHLAVFLARKDVLAPLRAVAIAQLGDLRDMQGKTDEAFAAYADSRSIWAGFHVPQWRDGEFGREQVLRLGAVLVPAAHA